MNRHIKRGSIGRVDRNGSNLPIWPVELRRYAKPLKRLFEKGMSGVCFDLDGVLINTMPNHAKAWLETVHAAGLSLTRNEVYQWEGEPGVATAKRLLERSGREPKPCAINALLDQKQRRFSDMSQRIEVEPHWLKVLKELRRKRLPMALVTGTSKTELVKLLPDALLREFDVVITGDQVKYGKPHPEPYISACASLMIRTENSLVIENAPYGIQSARSARCGCIVAITSSLPAKYLNAADVVVHRIDLLQRLLLYCAQARTW